MMLQAFCILDKAVMTFMPPFFVRARGEALRGFSELVNDPKTNIGKYPNDFVLMSIGEYDDNSGIFVGVEPVRVISGIECLNNVLEAESRTLDPPEVERRRRM